MRKTPSGWERRIAAALGMTAVVGLAFLAAAPASAQTTSTNAVQPRVTNLGPTPAPGVITAPNPNAASSSLPPGTTISRPPYQSNIGLPYGANVPAPYAYGATRPSTLAPTTTPSPGQAKGKATTAGATPGPGQQGTQQGTGTDTDEAQSIGAIGSPSPGVAAPVDRRLGLPQRMSSAPGNDQPPIKAQPDFKPGDPYARSAGSPALAQPFGVSPYRVPYSIDATGNYYSPPGTVNQNGTITPNTQFRGKVDQQGRIFDQYGNQRGVLK